MGGLRGLLEARAEDVAPSAGQRAVERIWRLSAHVTQSLPFSPEAVAEHLDLSASSFLELPMGSKAYALVCDYVSAHGDVRSVRYQPRGLAADFESEDEPRVDSRLTSLGIGLFPFGWRQHRWHALHQLVGHPVGTQCGVDRFTSLVLFAPKADVNLLAEFCHELVLDSERSVEGFVNIFEWDVQGQYWTSRAVCPARPLSSVVLNEEVKQQLVADMREFLGPETRRWYRDHGIPHKRGYLFHGVPGTGKTSLIQALAGHFELNLCYVHLTHPLLTDESLRAAVNSSPHKSILILEDVDAAFGKDREKLIKNSPLTFSGLLNALDGIGRADGQLFTLTTNHRERLNAALIRNGRVDIHVEFTYASDEQVAEMFARFYPTSSPNTAQRFVSNLRTSLAGRPVTCAVLQHFFILHRRSSPEKAIDSTQDVARELALRDGERQLHDEERERRRKEEEAAAAKQEVADKASKL